MKKPGIRKEFRESEYFRLEALVALDQTCSKSHLKGRCQNGGNLWGKGLRSDNGDHRENRQVSQDGR